MAEPYDDTGIFDMGTMDYLVFFIDDEEYRNEFKAFAKDVLEHDLFEPDFMANFEQFGPYVCLNVDGLPWEDVYHSFYNHFKLMMNDLIERVLMDTVNKAYLVVLDR